MALIADKTTSKRLEDRLNEFSKMGMTFYYLCEEGKIKVCDLEDLFFSKDDEKSCFVYGNIIRKVKACDLTMSYEKYKVMYPNRNSDSEELYQNNLNRIYTQKILDLICSNSDRTIDKVYVSTYEYLLNNSLSG